MEEAEARLRRHEKLGNSASNVKPNTEISTFDRIVGGIGPSGSAMKSRPREANTENLNLEYLKNITLRYIKASTISERKALIPVISAVLCLTEDETQKAIKAVDDSAGLSNVGNALFESTVKNFLVR